LAIVELSQLLNEILQAMLDQFRKLFSPAKPKLSEESRAFIEKLAPSFIWVLAIGIRGTPTISAVYDSSAWDTVAAHRIELGDIGDDDSVVPFNYKKDGPQTLPFFSSEELAKKYLANKSWGNISYFQPYRLLAGFVSTPENDLFELLLDPSFPSERKIEREERLLLRSLTTPAS
jgi:hypothetical protein